MRQANYKYFFLKFYILKIINHCKFKHLKMKQEKR